MIGILAFTSLVVAVYGDHGWDPNFCCYPVPDECCPATPPPPPCPPCLDVAFVVDISSSIGDVRLQTIINPYLQMFAESPLWTIGFGAGEVQASVTTFANAGILAWGWNVPPTANKAALSTAFSTLTTTQFQGLTNTGDGLKVTRTQVLEGPGNRPDCPDVCVIITDGHVTVDKPLFDEQAPLFRNACDLSVVVGIGTEVLAEELQQLATSFDNIFFITNFEDLANSFTVVLDQMMCPPWADAPSPATPDPEGCCPYEYPTYFHLQGVY